MFSHVVSVLVLQWMLCSKIVGVGQTIDDVCKKGFTSEYYRRALATVEQLVVKQAGVLDVSNVISAVVTSMLCSILSELCNLFFFSVLRVRFYINK